MGISLREWLAQRLSLSGRKAKTLLDARQIWVNRQCVWMAHHRLKLGDTIRLVAPARLQANPAIPEMLRLLFREGDFLFVFKPAGLLSVGRDSVEARLRRQLDLPALRAVHRLDRETSGCLLVATRPEAFEAAVSVFKTRKVHKEYQTIVQGRYQGTSSTIQAPIEGQRAISHLRCLRANADASLLRIRIETGRTHQIRRHLSLMRHPVLGDRDYGFKRQADPRFQQIPRLMLHASALSLPNPFDAERLLRAHAPLPPDFRHCLNLFRLS